MALLFSWDPRKADPDHSLGEQRFLLVGVTAVGHLVVVAHSGRGAASHSPRARGI
jgi:uncharacterized DUF497 family protein